jgi:prevent-host-death family protein
MKRFSIVQARAELGKLADEVQRTGQSIVLTRRGRPVARIAPEPAGRGRRAPLDALARVRGSVQMGGTFSDLRRAVRELRREGAQSLRQRGAGRGRGSG